MYKTSCKQLIGVVLLLALVVAGCGSTRQIETASPRPVNQPGLSGTPVSGMGLLTIDVETGDTVLPEEVQALRFRIDEVRLHTDEGEWITYPAELNSFEILPDRYVGKMILSTRVEPVLYDSISLSISDAFVLFGENAGGPLTLPRDRPFEVALQMQPEVGEVTQISLAIEPGASLYKDDACKWYFVPFWRVNLE